MSIARRRERGRSRRRASSKMLPALPRKLNALVDEARQKEMRDAYVHLVKIQQRQSLWLAVIAVALVLILLFK